MVINFRIHEINQGACRLTRTPTLIKKKQSFLVKNFTICKIYWNTLSLIKGKERPNELFSNNFLLFYTIVGVITFLSYNDSYYNCQLNQASSLFSWT